MSPLRRAWAAWATCGFGGFLALESYALRNEMAHDTLSAVTREMLGLTPRRRYARVTQPAFALGMIAFGGWFVPHILRVPLENS